MPQDENLEAIKHSQTAKLIRGQTEEWLIDREEDIIRQLVDLYRADVLTNDFLRGSIGEISGLRRFRENLEAKIRRGIAAAELELTYGESPKED